MDFFKRYSTLICVGSGGVGKTTLAASLAVLAARKGLKVLVLTIDPAKRLATSLGVSGSMGESVRVPLDVDGELEALVIDPKVEFDRFIQKSLKKESSSRIFQNVLYKQLSTTLSGSQEFTSMIKLLSVVESGDYDLVILDTPPAQHAKEFLTAPKKIYTLFDSSIVNWFLSLSTEGGSRGLMSKILHLSTDRVLQAFEKVTGSEFIQQLKDFFESVDGFKDKISQKSKAADELLMSSKCAFLLVTGFDESKLNEAEQFAEDLHKETYNLTHILVNRAFPLWWKSNGSKMKYEGVELNQFHEKFCSYLEDKEESYKRLEEKVDSSVHLIRLPEMNSDVCGVTELMNFSDVIEEEWIS